MGKIYIQPSIEVIEHNIDNHKSIMLQSLEQDIKQVARGNKGYVINDTALEILKKLDGTNTYEDIIKNCVQKYNCSQQEAQKKVAVFFNELKDTYGFEIREQKSSQLHEIKHTIYKNYYPSVISLEVTDNCNLFCRHCYGEFGQKHSTQISKPNLLKLIKSLSEIGVLTIELTGGDPSIYLYASDAIEFAFESGIRSVMFLTNGVKFDRKLIETFVKYRDHMFVQIDLHSLDENYYDWFTQTKNNLPKVKENIDYLISRGVQVRVCSIITPKNYHELLDIGEWAHKHGAINYAISPAIDIGRAKNNRDLFFMDDKSMIDFNEKINLLMERRPNLLKIPQNPYQNERINCGALASQCSIRTNGDIKLCTMDSGDYFNLNIGNVFEQSIKDIFDDNIDFVLALVQLDSPNSDICKECTSANYCNKCLLRGFLQAQEMKEKCRWYKNIPQNIKERFPN